MSSSQKLLLVSAILVFLLGFAGLLYLRTNFLPRRLHFPPPPVDTLAHKAYNLPEQAEVDPNQFLAPFLDDLEVQVQTTTFSEGKRHIEGGKLHASHYTFTLREPVCTSESGENLYGDWELEISEYVDATYAVIDFNQKRREAAEQAHGRFREKRGMFLTGNQVVRAEARSGQQAFMEKGLDQYWKLRVGDRKPAPGTYQFHEYGPPSSTPCEEAGGLWRPVISYKNIPDLTADTLLPRVYNPPLDTIELEKYFFTPYLEEMDVEKRETRYVNEPIPNYPVEVLKTVYSFSFKDPSATDEQGRKWYNTWAVVVQEFADAEQAVLNFNRDIKALQQYNKEGVSHQGNDSKMFISGNNIYTVNGNCRTQWFVNDAHYRMLRLVTRGLRSGPRNRDLHFLRFWCKFAVRGKVGSKSPESEIQNEFAFVSLPLYKISLKPHQ